jgi:hypothetical protein
MSSTPERDTLTGPKYRRFGLPRQQNLGKEFARIQSRFLYFNAENLGSDPPLRMCISQLRQDAFRYLL